MKKTYTIFIIQAYDLRTAEGDLIDNTTIEVISDTEKEAIAKAKKYIKKKGYRVSNIIEKLENDC